MKSRQSLLPAANFRELPPTVSKSAICALEQAQRANVSTYQVCYLTPSNHGDIEANMRQKMMDFRGISLVCDLYYREIQHKMAMQLINYVKTYFSGDEF